MASAASSRQRRRKPAVPAAPSGQAGAKLTMTIHTEAADRFRALPAAERRRRLEAFRATFAPAFQSVAEYVAEKRREEIRGR